MQRHSTLNLPPSHVLFSPLPTSSIMVNIERLDAFASASAHSQPPPQIPSTSFTQPSQTMHHQRSASPTTINTTGSLRSSPSLDFLSTTSYTAPSSYGNFTKDIDAINTASHMHTPLTHLPFSTSKWHVHPWTGSIYQVTGPVFDDYDPISGHVNSVGAVQETIEGKEIELLEGDVESGDGWRRCGIDAWAYGDTGAGAARSWGWNGYVEYRESGERSSIRREAKRGREEDDGEVRRKRVRVRD